MFLLHFFDRRIANCHRHTSVACQGHCAAGNVVSRWGSKCYCCSPNAVLTAQKLAVERRSGVLVVMLKATKLACRWAWSAAARATRWLVTGHIHLYAGGALRWLHSGLLFGHEIRLLACCSH